MRDFVPLFYGIRRLLPAGHTEGILTAFPVSKAVVTWTDQPISTDGVQVSMHEPEAAYVQTAGHSGRNAIAASRKGQALRRLSLS